MKKVLVIAATAALMGCGGAGGDASTDDGTATESETAGDESVEAEASCGGAGAEGSCGDATEADEGGGEEE